MSDGPGSPPGEDRGEPHGGSGDQPPGDSSDRPVALRLPGVRIAVYLFLVVLTAHFGGLVLLGIFAGDTIEALQKATDETERAALAASIPFGLVLLIQTLLTPLVVLVTWGMLRRVDRKPPVSIGIRWPADAARQGIISIAAAGAIAVLWLLTTSIAAELHFTGWAAPFVDTPLIAWGSVALYLVGFLIVAGLEELIFRGYVYSTLRERFNWANAAGISGVLFTLLHSANPEISPVALINTFLLALALAILRQTTGSLWAPTICHGIWNFMVGCVLSLPLSGLAIYPLFTVEVAGEVELTGGAYGPEGSLLLTALLLPIVAVLAYVLIESGGDEDGGEEDSGSARG